MDVCLSLSVLCCPVWVEALRWTDPPASDGEALSKLSAPCEAKEE
jgi:hypothetical protein